MKLNLLSRTGVTRIYSTALALLESTGMDIAGDEPRHLLLDVGAKERHDRICIGADLVEMALENIPDNGFEMAGRDGQRRCRISPGACLVRPAGGPPFVYDSATQQRRPATMDDARRIATVVDALDDIHVANCAASPADAGAGIRNVRRFVTALKHSTKPTDITASGPDEVAAVAEICLLFRETQEALERDPLAAVYVSPTSPMRLSENEALATIECARRGLPLNMLPCPTLAATAPITIAGAVAQEWAEQLCQLVLAYAIRPGLPVVACNRIFPADMHRGTSVGTGLPTGMAAAAFVEVATALGLPSNSWGFASASHVPDLQAGAERMLGALLAALAGCSVISGAGSLSSALVTSPEQMVIDSEIAGIVRHAAAGVQTTEETLATEFLEEGVLAGTFLASEHTLQQLHAGNIWMPDLFTEEPYEIWTEHGQELLDRARDRVSTILDTHQAPPLDSATEAEIERILSAAGA